MTNKTSEAVQKWLLRIHQSVPVGNVDFHKERAKAVAAKFNRMEDVLRILHDNQGGFGEITSIEASNLAADALAFDPLNSSSPNSL